MRRLRTTLTVGSAVLTAGAVAAAAIGVGGSSPSTGQTERPIATKPVTRADLTQTKQVNGVLGYGSPVTVNARGQGTVTWIAALGATVNRGQPLYKVDNKPVSLLHGDLPLYRPLTTGDTGDDVREVESNLAALGYGGFTVDTNFTSTTAVAVRRWQKDRGLTQTGVFEPAWVVIAPGSIRVTSHAIRAGEPSGGAVLAYSGTTRVVTIALDVALQRLAKAGAKAQVTLPDMTTVGGTLTHVGSVATAGQEANQPTTIEVIVSLDDQSKLGTLDQAPVIVLLTSDSVRDVLTVPVAALVALPEGGYGVQVFDGATSRYVPVRLGMFASGRVQISGDGIAEGTMVGVPS